MGFVTMAVLLGLVGGGLIALTRGRSLGWVMRILVCGISLLLANQIYKNSLK